MGILRCMSYLNAFFHPIRYRHMPGFGIDVVRKFTSSASEQKRLGARDYENLLQVSDMTHQNLAAAPHNL